MILILINENQYKGRVLGAIKKSSTPNTYLDDLEKASAHDENHFEEPNPSWPGIRNFFISARIAIKRWLRHENNREDGVEL